MPIPDRTMDDAHGLLSSSSALRLFHGIAFSFSSFARAPPSLSFRRPTIFLPSYPSLSRSLSRFPLFFPPYDSLRWLRTTKIGASPRLRLTRYYLQRTYVTFRTAYYCDYRRIMRRPNVLQFIIELL